MTERQIVRLLLVLLLVTSIGLLVLIIATKGSAPAVLQNIFGASGNQRRDVQPPRPAQISAEKPRPRTKQIANRVETPRLEIPRTDVPVLQVSVPLPPFPSRSEVRLGMSRTEFTDKFGEPDAAATWYEKGILHEKLLYRSLEKSAEIAIDGGRVASISSNEQVR
jgi:hypothetical protein